MSSRARSSLSPASPRRARSLTPRRQGLFLIRRRRQRRRRIRGNLGEAGRVAVAVGRAAPPFGDGSVGSPGSRALPSSIHAMGGRCRSARERRPRRRRNRRAGPAPSATPPSVFENRAPRPRRGGVSLRGAARLGLPRQMPPQRCASLRGVPLPRSVVRRDRLELAALRGVQRARGAVSRSRPDAPTADSAAATAAAAAASGVSRWPANGVRLPVSREGPPRARTSQMPLPRRRLSETPRPIRARRAGRRREGGVRAAESAAASMRFRRRGARLVERRRSRPPRRTATAPELSRAPSISHRLGLGRPWSRIRRT